MDNQRLYIAYGSNINLQQMSMRCPTAKTVCCGYLPGYELEFRGVATIVPKENAKVPVLMWQLEESDERALDRYEGYPRLYRKETLEFMLDGEPCSAMVYLMNAGHISQPTAQYYNCIEQGYRSVGLDTTFLEEARDRAMQQDLNNFQEFKMW